MDNRPIGVFDSGLGGLTVVKELAAALPNESIVYFGDTARVPYGTRSRETIIKYALQDARFLISQNIKAIVVACGTVSSIALFPLQNAYKIPIIGVVDATATAAAAVTVNKKVGILGTTGTIKSGSFEKMLYRIDNKIKAVPKACPMFVPLVENGFAQSDAAHFIANEYLADLKQEGVDTIILGCTHYPLLKGLISDIMGEGVRLVDSAEPTAKYIAELLAERDILSNQGAKYSYYVSDAAGDFAKFARLFLGVKIPVDNVSEIDIEMY
ncbi:MAG: glutamate racemase [Firmicutes bacterium]|nr:glutamate racemase [Bacillota bacterium]